MRFLWDEHNTAHLAAHGVSPGLAEAIFHAGSDEIFPSRIAHRFAVEADVDGRRYRLVFDVSREGALYPVTCFPLPRRTP
jgi:hypothetical protein